METQKVGKVLRSSLLKGIKDGVQNNQAVFLMSYTKLSSSKMDGLRKNLHKVGASLHVPKNRVAKIALKELKNDQLADTIKGQTAFIWTSSDAVTVAKALVKFVEQFETVKLNGGLLDGALLEKGDIKRLSDLPAKEVLQAKLLGLLNAPASRLLNALNAKSRDLLSILKQYSEKKGGN